MAELAPGFSSVSRQKSCYACVRGKRGCDRRHPVCSRCEERNIQCIFAKRTYAEAFCDVDSVELDTPWVGSTILSSSIDFNHDVPPSVAPSAILEPTTLLTPDSFIDHFITFAEDQVTPSSNMQHIDNAGEPLGQQHEEEQALSKFDYDPMADLCIQYEPWQVYDPNTKVHFIVENLKGYPGTFARDNCTPWMHRYLYKDQIPSSIQSCFTVSTLYSNITSSNKTSVFKVLCQNLNELKRQQLANGPQEKLARVQALFLYQIISLFDGDITLRSNADRNMPLLQAWIDELCKIRENPRTRQSINRLDHSKSWEWWVFSESVRRTIVIAYAFLGLWNVMCKNNEDIYFNAWKYPHRWTMSRPLWEAPSSFDFIQTRKTYHVIENFELKSFLQTGAADDVDDFSKVFIVAYMGLDKTKQWFMDRGCEF